METCFANLDTFDKIILVNFFPVLILCVVLIWDSVRHYIRSSGVWWCLPCPVLYDSNRRSGPAPDNSHLAGKIICFSPSLSFLLLRERTVAFPWACIHKQRKKEKPGPILWAGSTLMISDSRFAIWNPTKTTGIGFNSLTAEKKERKKIWLTQGKYKRPWLEARFYHPV